ncbi:MAG TPA: SRPBCC family protein [Candidatus Thermoplasmatota archaeon]|nr:SRPBCC family protein [Candidatus Thermoplasmatota archaeon]
MAPITWRHTATVAAPADRVYQWLSDFREDDHSRPAYLAATGGAPKPGKEARRHILSRDADAVVIEDHWGGRTFLVTAYLDPVGREVRLEGGLGYHAVWRAVSEGPLTRIELEGRMAPRGLLGFVLPLFKRSFLKQIAQDFRGHVADLESELVAAAEIR